jgi:hypothetical protein
METSKRNKIEHITADMAIIDFDEIISLEDLILLFEASVVS